MKVNITALKQLAENKSWSIPDLAKHLGVNYSYLFRILRGEKNGGSKLFSGIYHLCLKEGLSMDDYLSWDELKEP
jgi:transcriptional regulator with XRE-family HTH domain